MLQHRFQNLIKLLIALQLLLPSGAPWLHTVIDGSCCAASVGYSPSCCISHSHLHCSGASNRGNAVHSHGNSHKDAHSCSSHSASKPGHSHRHLHDESSPNSDPEQPHDCSNCPVCQAISAPRILALILQLPEVDERIECLATAECADPLLGFGLPLQCRAPPAVA